jgi:hypothetical protein
MKFDNKTKPGRSDVVHGVAVPKKDQAKFKFDERKLPENMWPCGGQHAMTALKRLDDQTKMGSTDLGLWQERVEVTVVMYDPTNEVDVTNIGLLSKKLNIRHEIRLKQDFGQNLHMRRNMLESECKAAGFTFTDGYSVTEQVYSKMLERTNISKGKFQDYWRILRLPASIYDKLEPLYTGNAVNTDTGKPIKAPASGSHFAVTGPMPFDTINRYVDKLVTGMWTPNFFLRQCKLWKATVKGRMAICRYAMAKFRNKLPPDLVKAIEGTKMAKTKSKLNDKGVKYTVDVGLVWKKLAELFPLLKAKGVLSTVAANISDNDMAKPVEIVETTKSLIDSCILGQVVMFFFCSLLSCS